MAGILAELYGGADAARTEKRPGRFRVGLARMMSLIVLSPSLLILGVFVYGFAIWSLVISMTSSKLAPKYDFVGLEQYFALWSMDRWHVAVSNLAIFAGLFISLSVGLGLLLAIFLDQRIRAENVIRSIYLYPMAISFIVTGTAWKWILNPGLGIEKLVRDLGWTSFSFDWVVNPNMSVYTLVIAAVWQSSGFAMAIFLAGLRGVDQEIIKAARIDGAGPWLIYRAVIIPMLRPVFLTVVVILTYQAVRSFDLVVSLTGGGPGFSSDLPATFMYQFAFSRNRMALAAASGMMIFMTIAAVMVPYIYSELRREARNER
jgi:glucose/mannose transport system permease protein